MNCTTADFHAVNFDGPLAGRGRSTFATVTVVSNTTSSPRDIPAEWSAQADALADWAGGRLVNRCIRFGSYRSHRDRAGGLNKSFTAWRLTPDHLVRHFVGADVGDIVGLHAVGLDDFGNSYSRWVAIDIDRHDEGIDRDATERYAKLLFARAAELGLEPLLIDSNGDGGFHLWVVFETPVKTPVLFDLGRWLTRDSAEFGFDPSPEVFPKQRSIKTDPRAPGSWLRLPGRHHTREHWSRVWGEGRWLVGQEATAVLLETTGVSASLAYDLAVALASKPAVAVTVKSADELVAVPIVPVAELPVCVRDEQAAEDSGEFAVDEVLAPAPPWSPTAANYTGARLGNPRVMAKDAIRDHPIGRKGTRHNVHDGLVAQLLGLDYHPDLVLEVVLRHYDYYQDEGVIDSPRAVAESEARAMIAHKLGSTRFTPYLSTTALSLSPGTAGDFGEFDP